MRGYAAADLVDIAGITTTCLELANEGEQLPAPRVRALKNMTE